MSAPDLAAVLAGIDAANAADPATEDGQPACLLYGHRMSTECARLFPDASELLRIACRGQHVERWVLARDSYPEGRQGYLTWRQDLARHHAARVGEIMRDAGYDAGAIDRVGGMLRKTALRRDPETQALEDVICFVFLRWYFAPFAAKHAPDKVQRIVAKTARKMSPAAQNRVLAEFALPADLAAAFAG